MNSVLESNRLSVIKIVQELLLAEADKAVITPSLIAEKITMATMMMPKWGEGLDRDSVTDELIRRFSVWRGVDASLVSTEGHLPWLTAERKKDWRYWQRYRELQEQRMAWDPVDGMDKSTDKILGMLEDPVRPGPWDRRGLVVGHVQSGKTGNYAGLICKAADAGYKIIIVLAGLHNNLRSQTQMRLDEGFLGFETDFATDGLRAIGVGLIDRDPAIRPNFATNRTEKGDFISSNIKNLGISPEQRPWLFVVKKNKTVLTRLYRWIEDHVANVTDPETGRKLVTHLPLLVIDDEADHASVDTGEQFFDEDGKADFEHQPTAINSLIRKILHVFQRKAYVGYTATPFANIFIHERGETAGEGPDLFPSAFIHNLGAPSNYVGPARVFGLNNGEEREGGLPLIREVEDHNTDKGKSGWMPTSHKSSHRPVTDSESGMPDSLCEAIDSFILACAVRHLRGQKAQHSSMLVHVTRFNAVQKFVFDAVESYVRRVEQRLVRRVGHEPVLARLESLWSEDFVPASEAVRELFPGDSSLAECSWEQIADVLPLIVSEISVRMINGTAGDALDYVDSAGGLKVIAIGGDKLARGLTLEGLCTSYFLRASRMYDTLMQMGRWFGYRPGYLDLCRLYTTADLIEWFEHIADASEELRDEFEMMVESGGTPRDYGLKVVSHPVLMVTSRLKMRSARSLYLSFSGHVSETVAFYKETAVLDRNFEAFKALVAALPAPARIPDQVRNGATESWNGVIWKDISYERVTEFLTAYRTHAESTKVNSQLLRDFIESMARVGELTSWTIAVIGGAVEDNPVAIGGGLTVKQAKRKSKTPNEENRYSIGRLLSPKDEGIDLDETAWQAALTETQRLWREDTDPLKRSEPTVPNGPALRRVRGFGADGVPARPDSGLLLIYLLDAKASEAGIAADTCPVVAFGISFPGSSSGTKVEYKVNNVLWEQEYATSGK